MAEFKMALPVEGKAWLYTPPWKRAWLNTLCAGIKLGKMDWENKRWPINRQDFHLLRQTIVRAGHSVEQFIQSRGGTGKCDIRCTSAQEEVCVCSCGGLNHGNRGVADGAILVGDTTLVVPGELYWTYRRFEAS